jgi:putative transposase
MESRRRGSHTVWNSKYHLVWVTKYCYPVLGGDVARQWHELLREAARAREIVIHAGVKSGPRALAAVDPCQSIGVACRAMSERGSSYKLLSEFGSLRKHC